MVNLFGLNIKSIISRTMSGQLLRLDLIRVSRGAFDPSDPGSAPSEAREAYTFEGVVESFDDGKVDGTVIQSGDLKVLVIAGSLPDGIIPVPGDYVSISSGERKVVSVKTDPAGATYTCQVR